MEPAMAKDDPARDARLAEALRQNLRRRKAQAREVEEFPGAVVEAGAPDSEHDA
jgi:hypothetical protein